MFEHIKRLLKHTVIYGSGGVAMEAARFLLIPLYTRYLTPEDYGVLELVMITFMLLRSVSKIGLKDGFFKSYFAESTDEGRKRVASTTMISLAIASIFFTCGLLAFARSIAHLIVGDGGKAVLFRILSITLFFHILSSTPLQILRANERSLKYSILSFGTSLFGIILTIFFVVALRMGVAGILSSGLITHAILCLFLIPTGYASLKPMFSFKILKQANAYGLPIVLSGLLGWLKDSADRFLLKRFSSLNEVGLYSLGARFGLPVALAANAFEVAWFPFIFSIEDKEDEKDIHSRTLTYFLFFASFLWLIMSISAKEIIGLMTTPAFHNAYKVVPLLAGMQVLYGAYCVTRAGILLSGKTAYTLLTSAVTAVASIGLNWILIPRFGIMGAGVAALMSNFALYSITHIVSYRLYPIPCEFRRISKIVLIALTLYAISTMVRGAYLTTLFLKSLIVLSYPLLLGLVGFYEQSEISRIKLAGSRTLNSFRKVATKM